jgi:hypothetical protein
MPVTRTDPHASPVTPRLRPELISEAVVAGYLHTLSRRSANARSRRRPARLRTEHERAQRGRAA